VFLIIELKKIFNFASQSTFIMNDQSEYLGQLAEIRRMMEKSSKFMSLSGFSGIFIGFYALIGAYVTWRLLQLGTHPVRQTVFLVVITAAAVLTAALVTAFLLTLRRSRKLGYHFWGPGSKQMLASLLVPLLTGGIFAVILVLQAQYLFVASVLLVFYGLALTSSSRFAHRELFSMGIIQIILGLAAVWFPLYGLLFWACGFGIVHIIYGILMYLKYEVTNKNIR
jgi:hypothetical protein